MKVIVPAYHGLRNMPAQGGFVGGGGDAPEFLKLWEADMSENGPMVRGFQPESTPIITRGMDPNEFLQRREMATKMAAGINESINRGVTGDDPMGIIKQVGEAVDFLTRNINSQTPYLPIRENLEGEVTILMPLDTPFRNRISRHPGAGRASAWKQIQHMGGGWGTAVPQPGGGSSVRAFFQETGAPAEHTTSYAERSAIYKLLGTFGSVTGFGAAQAMNFSNQLAGEKTRAIRNLMLNEEFALINGDASSVAAPWGDGVNALAFNGLDKSISTANGVPSAQVVTVGGPLTTAAIDNMLTALWNQGVTNPWMMMGAQEVLSLVHLAQSASSIIRMQASTDDGGTLLGVKIVGYVHPISREIVPILASRFIVPGNIYFGCDATPDGHPVMDVDVLPQVQLPALAPNTMVQGYTAQELAPTTSSPQVFAFIVTVYETFRLKHPLYVGVLKGCTAA